MTDGGADRGETKREIETPLGPVWLWGRDTGQPVLLLICGTFANFAVLDHLWKFTPGVDVWRAHLPGNHSPPLAATSVGAFAGAFSHAIERAFGDRPVLATGLSVGGLVAMGLRAPGLKRLLLVEPPVLTAGISTLADVRDQAPPGFEDFLWNVLGLAPGRIEPRDYTPVLEGLARPALVLIGERPGDPPPPAGVMPSMITPAARAALAAHPLVEIADVPGAGHNIPRRTPEVFLRAVTWSCRAAFAPEAISG